MKKIVIRSYMVGMVQTNVYYLHREGESAAIIFDPADYGRELYEALTKQGLEIKAIFLTHGHFDHISGVKAGKEVLGDIQLRVSGHYGSGEDGACCCKDEGVLVLCVVLLDKLRDCVCNLVHHYLLFLGHLLLLAHNILLVVLLLLLDLLVLGLGH